MNSTLGFWLIGAGVAALALLLLLGAPTGETELSPDLEAASELGTTEAMSRDVETTYWQPVVEEASASQVVYAPVSSVAPVGATAPCPRCGLAPVVPATSTGALFGGCGYPSTPCGKPTCSYCPSKPTPTVPVTPTGVLAGGCGRPSTACGGVLCAPLARQCYDVCADPCRVAKPGINRNMPLCVDECSFIQLHSTVSHPICGQVSFEWSASKGWFLDPTASDPLFFAPTTQFCNGEDVWITLLVTDVSGASYSDVVSVHIRDLP
jgi:hypothetical protein